jgi:predicted small lipoprotein YifL
MRRAAAVLMFSCLLAGCGQKGALFLPVKPGAAAATATPAAAGSAQPVAPSAPADAAAAPGASTTPAKKPSDKDGDTPAPQ